VLPSAKVVETRNENGPAASYPACCQADDIFSVMSIFTTPFPQLGTADLQELIEQKAVENVRLEFKLEIPSKDDTLKKLSSFANTFGGFMVIGGKAPSKDGRIEELPGVDVQPGYKQTISQWCFDGASPPLIAEVSDPIPAPAGNGKVCYVIYVTESDVAPHFLNGRRGVWVRTDEFSARFEAHLANENELRHLLDRRRFIVERRAALLERARRRLDAYTAKKYTGAGGMRTRVGACLEMSVAPRFPARPMCGQRELKSMVVGSRVQWRGVGFPQSSNNTVSQHESEIVLQPTTGFSIFEANVWGMLFYSAKVEVEGNETTAINLHVFVGHVLVFLRHAEKMLRAYGYSGPIVIETTLASILGVKWAYQVMGFWEFEAGSELDDQVTFTIETTTEALHENSDLCRDGCPSVGFLFGQLA
jgi:hypothetical protein